MQQLEMTLDPQSPTAKATRAGREADERVVSVANSLTSDSFGIWVFDSEEEAKAIETNVRNYVAKRNATHRVKVVKLDGRPILDDEGNETGDEYPENSRAFGLVPRSGLKAVKAA